MCIIYFYLVFSPFLLRLRTEEYVDDLSGFVKVIDGTKISTICYWGFFGPGGLELHWEMDVEIFSFQLQIPAGYLGGFEQDLKKTHKSSHDPTQAKYLPDFHIPYCIPTSLEPRSP